MELPYDHDRPRRSLIYRRKISCILEYKSLIVGVCKSNQINVREIGLQNGMCNVTKHFHCELLIVFVSCMIRNRPK